MQICSWVDKISRKAHRYDNHLRKIICHVRKSSVEEEVTRCWWKADLKGCGKDLLRMLVFHIGWGSHGNYQVTYNSFKAFIICWIHIRHEQYCSKHSVPFWWSYSIWTCNSTAKRLPLKRSSHEQVARTIFTLWHNLENRKGQFAEAEQPSWKAQNNIVAILPKLGDVHFILSYSSDLDLSFLYSLLGVRMECVIQSDSNYTAKNEFATASMRF